MMHAELAEEGDRLHYHRTLNKACKHDLPLLEKYMERNLYAAAVLDLVYQKKQELEEMEDEDPLYLLEMALGLAKIGDLVPHRVHLLNMVAFHQDRFGSLDQLRGNVTPRDAARRFLAAEKKEPASDRDHGHKGDDNDNAARTH